MLMSESRNFIDSVIRNFSDDDRIYEISRHIYLLLPYDIIEVINTRDKE